jgi:site-specific DNA-methyltransferase (adenine-specific)
VIKPLVEDADLVIYQGDCLNVLCGMKTDSADACVTSPPYLDARPEYPSPSPTEFTLIFTELRRVVSGPLLLNVGRLWRDRKELLWWTELLDCSESAGWPLRDTLIWIKPNANPLQGEILTSAHEYVFLLGDEFNVDEIRTPYAEESLARYGRKFDANAGVKNSPRPNSRDARVGTENELGARPRSYVEVYTGREKGNPHPAPMPIELAVHLVKLAAPAGGTIIDPFGGSGNTAAAARSQGRKSILIELSPEYAALAASRLAQQSLLA